LLITLYNFRCVKPNIPDTTANIKQKSLHRRYFNELEQPEINIQASHAWLKKSNIHPETEGFIFVIQDRVINTRNYKKHICGLQSIIDKCRICGTEGETIEHMISSCTVLTQSEYKKRHDIQGMAGLTLHRRLANSWDYAET
jgi:hypothetical protein